MTTKLEWIYALNLYLFTFKLQSGLTDDLQPISNTPKALEDQYKPILEKFVPKFENMTSQPQIREDNPQAEMWELLENQRKYRNFCFWESSAKNQNLTQPKPLLKLLLYLLRIGDTYTLLLHLFRPQSPGYDIVKLTDIQNEFKSLSFILKDQKADFLGQTLLVTAFLPETVTPTPENLRSSADELRQELFGEFCNSFYQNGQFLGSYICEYGNPKELRDRIFILFYQTETTPQKLQPIYWNLPEFFLYYHKIVHTFQYSRKAYQEADEIIRTQVEPELRKILKLKSEIELSDSDLDNLKNNLITLIKVAPEYTLKLRNLEYTLNTLNIHVGNYQRYLKRLQHATKDELEFLTQFLNRECQTFPTQIQADLNYLKPASHLLDQGISSIRGLVEIEQAKLDRKKADQLRQTEETKEKREKSLERTISTLGFGLGAGGIASSITSAYIKQPLTLSYLEKSLSFAPFIQASLLSVAIGAIAGFITWKITQRWK